MQKRNFDNWKYDKSLEGLLFFAQLIDEMVSIFTIDSYRAPVFNSHSLCEEFRSVYYEVEDGFLHERTLKPIIEELIWNLKQDPVAKQILGFRFSQIISELENVDKTQRYLDSYPLLSSLRTLLDQQYLGETKRQIIEIVKKPQEKDKISILGKLLISELIYFGYSREYIRQILVYHFFQKQPVSSIEVINNFLNSFDFKNGKWEVIFRGNDHFRLLKDLKMNDIEFLVSDLDLRPRTKYFPERKFYENDDARKDFSIYAQFKHIQAYDPYEAKENAAFYLRTLDDVSAFSIHKERLKWHSQAIVYSEDYDFFKVVDEYSPILSIKDSEMGDFQKKSPIYFTNYSNKRHSIRILHQ